MRILIALVVAVLASPAIAQSLYVENKFTVVANQPWTDTGIIITGDTQVYITATGFAEWSPGRAVSPLGDPSLYLNHVKSNLILPGAPQFSLLCRVGKGPIFYVGTGISGRLNPAYPGRIRCTMNESTGAGAYTDNSGGFQVTILSAAAS
jgi:hypothetical protein